MITGLLITAFLASLAALTSLLPVLSFPTTGASAAGTFGATLDTFLPVEQIALAALAVLAWRLGMAGWNLIVWVYHQFWGSD